MLPTMATIFVILAEANVESLRLVATHSASVEGIEPPLRVLETPALPLRHTEIILGADSQARTGDILLGKQTFYQLNYIRNSFYATKVLKRSAAYDAANAFGFINGITLHVPLI